MLRQELQHVYPFVVPTKLSARTSISGVSLAQLSLQGELRFPYVLESELLELHGERRYMSQYTASLRLVLPPSLPE